MTYNILEDIYYNKNQTYNGIEMKQREMVMVCNHYKNQTYNGIEIAFINAN